MGFKVRSRIKIKFYCTTVGFGTLCRFCRSKTAFSTEDATA